MRNSLVFLKKSKIFKEFIKFSIVGGICTIFDFLIYLFLTRLFSFWQRNFLWANFLSTSLSATLNFFLNKYWTFKNKSLEVLPQYIKFWVVVIGGIILYQIIFAFTVKSFKFYDLLGKVIATLIVWILRFIFNKYWTFAKYD
jgi:putative flippase GtrA